MANNYFKNLPDFEYVNRTEDGKRISDYTKVKNLFKRGKLREDIFQNTTFFEKYQIEGDDRPDNVADKVYGDPTLDWVVLLSNNIINIQLCFFQKKLNLSLLHQLFFLQLILK